MRKVADGMKPIGDTLGDMKRFPRLKLQGSPLSLQIVGLLLGGLVVAQLVTLFLTFLLPPAPQPKYGLDTIALALAGELPEDGAARPLLRRVSEAPPSLSGPGWLTADFSRRDLARMLAREERDVQLFFHTPLPFAGTAGQPRRETQFHRCAMPLRGHSSARISRWRSWRRRRVAAFRAALFRRPAFPE
jgi:hypothetical protein